MARRTRVPFSVQVHNTHSDASFLSAYSPLARETITYHFGEEAMQQAAELPAPGMVALDSMAFANRSSPLCRRVPAAEPDEAGRTAHSFAHLVVRKRLTSDADPDSPSLFVLCLDEILLNFDALASRLDTLPDDVRVAVLHHAAAYKLITSTTLPLLLAASPAALTSLSLGRCGVSDEMLRQIAAACPNLQHLAADCEGCLVSAEALASLADRCPSMRTLALRDAQLHGAQLAKSLAAWRKLDSLDISKERTGSVRGDRILRRLLGALIGLGQDVLDQCASFIPGTSARLEPLSLQSLYLAGHVVPEALLSYAVQAGCFDRVHTLVLSDSLFAGQPLVAVLVDSLPALRRLTVSLTQTMVLYNA